MPKRNSTPSATSCCDAPLDEPLLDLELRHPEADEAPGRLVALVDDDVLAGARELLGAGEPGRPGADDGDAAPGLPCRRLRLDPAFAPTAVDDRELDLLDRDGVPLVDLEHAGRLARRGTEPAGELGEVVRSVELLEGFLPTVAIDEVVPVRDEVPDRTAVMTERDAALHAAGGLLAQLDERQRADELAEVADALGRRPLGRLDAVQVEEGADLAHYARLFGLGREEPAAARRDGLREGALVVVRDHLHEPDGIPVLEQCLRDRRAGSLACSSSSDRTATSSSPSSASSATSCVLQRCANCESSSST